MGNQKKKNRKEKKYLVSSTSDSRKFLYTKSGIVLSFTLRIDINSELEIFKELLERASEDVTEVLGKRNH